MLYIEYLRNISIVGNNRRFVRILRKANIFNQIALSTFINVFSKEYFITKFTVYSSDRLLLKHKGPSAGAAGTFFP